MSRQFSTFFFRFLFVCVTDVSASDSKNTAELVVAKEQMRIAVAERLASVAKIDDDVIELSDESDDEEDPNRPIIIPMSCYAVDDSDDDTEEEGKEKGEKEEEEAEK